MEQNQAIKLFLESGALATIGGIAVREVWRQARRGVFRATYRKIRRSKGYKALTGLFWALLPYLVIGSGAYLLDYPRAIVWIPVVLICGIVCTWLKPARLWFVVLCALSGVAAWWLHGQPGLVVVVLSGSARFVVAAYESL